MAITLEQLKGYVTGEACRQYLDRNIGLVSFSSRFANNYHTNFQFINNSIGVNHHWSSETSGWIDSVLDFNKDIIKLNNDKTKRIVGLVTGENDDGSLQISIMGNETVTSAHQANIHFYGSGTSDASRESSDANIWHSNIEPTFVYSGSGSSGIYNYVIEGNGNTVDLADIFDYVPTLEPIEYNRGTLEQTCRQGNTPLDSQNPIRLLFNNNKDTTVKCGVPISGSILSRWLPFEFLRDESPYNMISGDFYTFLEWVHSLIYGRSTSFVWGVIGTGYYEIIDPPDPDNVGQLIENHSLQTVPVNLILTRNEGFAKSYLANGTLPPDAFLYPLDWNNFPQITPSGDDDEEETHPDDDPDNGETGPSGIEGTPTTDADPHATTSKINSNNVYWLQTGQLQAFINWFWNDAGQIIDLGSLWDKITGLYNDLGSTVLMVRYFPVNPNYIGGTAATNQIIVGMVAQENINVLQLLKNNPTKVTLGQVEIVPKYNAFTDYSPYTELQLYLPFHGWLALDVDLFMGNILRVKAIYDYMSGTVQYLIYVVEDGAEYLVNTSIVKMAIDIPITLQSKNDRDSAIFNNVSNAMGNLLGAGASVATLNPIGLVMSTSHIASSGTQSAPLKTLGTQGENGSLFAPNKCAIYLKRPSYNRPKAYQNRVGYPCNKGCYLGSAPSGQTPAKGFTTVYNPTITFSGNSSGGKVIKPTKAEIEEIYEYLEKGVIV